MSTVSFVSMLTVGLDGYRKLNHLIYASTVSEYSNVHGNLSSRRGINGFRVQVLKYLILTGVLIIIVTITSTIKTVNVEDYNYTLSACTQIIIGS